MKVDIVNSKYIYESYRFNSDFHLTEGVIYDKWFRTIYHKTLSDLTSGIFCAGRAKRIYVTQEYGVPFLGNSDVVSISPLSRCNYASKKFWNDKKSYIKEGMILTGRVGQNTVGTFTWATQEIDGAIGSDNIIRIIPNGVVSNGYLYSFLASKFGHHLSRRHISGNAQPFITEEMLAQIPIPIISESIQKNIDVLIKKSSVLRVEANELLNQAVNFFENEIGKTNVHLGHQMGMISSRSINNFQIRLDGQYELLWKALKMEFKEQLKYERISNFAKSIFVGGRGKRIYVENGIPFLSSSDMMLFNPKRRSKKISRLTPGLDDMTVDRNEILISRSGTVGNTALVGDYLAGTAISEHALRLVIDDEKINPNYVFCFLKTSFGMKSMEASSFGSVIITLNEDLIGDIRLPILDEAKQNQISALVGEYVKKLDKSMNLENEAIDIVEKEIGSWQK